MKNKVVLCALAAVSSGAAAQTGSLSIVPSIDTLDWTTETTMTLSVFGDADFATHIAGGAFGIQVTGGENTIVNMTGTAADWGALGERDIGYSGNGMYDGLIYGQLIHLPQLPPDPASALGSGPVLLGTVEVTFSAGYLGSAHFAVVDPGTDFVMQVFDEINEDGGGLIGTYTTLSGSEMSYGSATVQVVPSPSAIGMLGLGGLIASRRRR
jgi:hypothetical protein